MFLQIAGPLLTLVQKGYPLLKIAAGDVFATRESGVRTGRTFPWRWEKSRDLVGEFFGCELAGNTVPLSFELLSTSLREIAGIFKNFCVLDSLLQAACNSANLKSTTGSSPQRRRQGHGESAFARCASRQLPDDP
jgi:hypothetical protein